MLKSSEGTLAVNADDIKRVVINKSKMTADIHTSEHYASFNFGKDLEKSVSKLEDSISKRYNVVHISSEVSCQTCDDAYTAILKVSNDGSDTYIWPSGLTSIKIQGDTIDIGAHGNRTSEFHRTDDLISVKLNEPISLNSATEVFKLLNCH
jgi:hypothetical protein